MSCAQSIRLLLIVCLLLCGRDKASAVAILGNSDSCVASSASMGSQSGRSFELIQEAPPLFSDDYLGFVDGPNLYAYVKQNPWTGFDPEGLWVEQQLPEWGKAVWKGLDATVHGAISQADHMADTAIDASRVYHQARSQGEGVASAGIESANYSLTRETGALGLIEAFNGSKITPTEGGTVNTEMSNIERIVHGTVSGVQLVGTATALTAGASATVKAAAAEVDAVLSMENSFKFVTVDGAANTSPLLTHPELAGKTADEIRALASEKGLSPHATKPDKWMDPVTGKERLRIDLGHTDKKTGLPYNDPKAASPHHHGYESDGKTKIIDPSDQNPHIPTRQ